MKRKIDDLGRLCIPKEMRKQLGINDNDPVNVELVESSIILTNPGKVDYKQRIDKAIEYMKPIFMNCIDNDKRYFEDPYIQRVYEILKGE